MPVLPVRAGFLACFFLLTACAAVPVPPRPAAAVAPREPDVAQQVLDYQAWLAQQSEESLAAESSRLQQSLSPRAQLDKALLLAAGHRIEDLEAGLAALASLQASSDSAARALQPVAALLAGAWQADLQEQKRQQEQQERLQQQLRDSQRRNEQLGERVEQLGHKLEALKSIELNLPKPAGNTAPSSPVPALRSPAS